MGLFKKKCEHCKEKIEKGEEVVRKVKDPLFIDLREKSFCCENHADAYEKEKGSCCGSDSCGCK